MTAKGLEARGITKDFGSLRALDEVTFRLERGEVHALVGENGAGKSTLVKVMAGLLQPTSGVLLIDGEPRRVGSRAASASQGIGVVHQHLSLVGPLSVAEHMLLGRPGHGRRIDLAAARAESLQWCARLGLDLDPDRPVRDFPLGTRQLIELSCALAWGARYLVLDEPTAVLGPVETDNLVEVIRGLRGQGVGIILISHKLPDVLAIADRITVLRRGRVVAHRAALGATAADLAREMVGAEIRVDVPMRAADSAPAAGSMRLIADAVAAPGLEPTDLAVGAGEVVGVAGVAGNGQIELLEVLAGIRPCLSGTVSIDGRTVTGDPVAALSAGVAYIPEDRHRDAVAQTMPVWANSVVKRSRRPEMRKRAMLDRTAARRFARVLVQRFRVTPGNPAIRVASLSGGNQQRLVVGRELSGSPSIVLAAEPSRGLDPQSMAEVRANLKGIAGGGAAVVIVSSDLDELLELADRIVVMFERRIVQRLDRRNSDRDAIGLAMVGASGSSA